MTYFSSVRVYKEKNININTGREEGKQLNWEEQMMRKVITNSWDRRNNY